MGKRGPKPGAKRAALAAASGEGLERERRHWVFAKSPVIEEWESEEGWREHLRGLVESLRPEGQMEVLLVERVAGLLWRLRRVVAFEAESLAADLSSEEREWHAEVVDRAQLEQIPSMQLTVLQMPLEEEWRRKWLARRMVPRDGTMERVLRYEAHLHRQLLQTMHELEALQARRKGEAAPLARVDVAGGPGG